MKIPTNIDNKLLEKCKDKNEAYKALKELIDSEINSKSKQNIKCKEIVEKYIEECKKNENQIY